MFPEIARDDVFRIETRRLWLRWPRMADAVAIARQAGVKAVAEMTATIRINQTEADAVAFVLAAREINSEGAGLSLVITPQRRPDQVIGAIGIVPGTGNRPTLGYWIAEEYWGQGFATEAAHALIDATFGLTGCPAIVASAAPMNAASRRVLKKCGFGQTGMGMAEAPARGGPQAVDFFRLDRSTWSSLKGWREPRFVREDAMPMAAQ